ncbi:hypothetical protein HJC23_004153 [Cyclotella cryptica]|uniref:HSF-type DNA-binding domain-containing protein n=1 Tax=Cyclotella cryptica TaxID=29204 RepID=A0ABD3PHU5_9STRA
MDDGNEDRDRDKKRKKGWRKSSRIDHTYYDFSTRELNSADEQKGRVTFPMKLHGIVSNPAYRHIICWMPHGRSWKILDKELLASVVCKKYFNHDNFDSFNRSVNGWGFKVRKEEISLA